MKTELEKITDEIEKVVMNIEILNLPNSDDKKYRILIRHKYREIAFILRRSIKDIEEQRKLLKIISQSTDSQTGKDYGYYSDSYSIDIQTIYIWIHDIYKILKNSKKKLENISRLEEEVIIRNKFIAEHLTETDFFKQMNSDSFRSMSSDAGPESTVINFHNFPINPIPKELIEELGKFIPAVHEEKSTHRRSRLMLSNLDKITDQSVKRKARKLIETIGISTRPIIEIAQILLDTLKEYLSR